MRRPSPSRSPGSRSSSGSPGSTTSRSGAPAPPPGFESSAPATSRARRTRQTASPGPPGGRRGSHDDGPRCREHPRGRRRGLGVEVADRRDRDRHPVGPASPRRVYLGVLHECPTRRRCSHRSRRHASSSKTCRLIGDTVEEAILIAPAAGGPRVRRHPDRPAGRAFAPRSERRVRLRPSAHPHLGDAPALLADSGDRCCGSGAGVATPLRRSTRSPADWVRPCSPPSRHAGRPAPGTPPGSCATSRAGRHGSRRAFRPRDRRR